MFRIPPGEQHLSVVEKQQHDHPEQLPMRRGKRRRGSDGCGYLTWVCLMACLLLIVNAVVLRAFYVWYLPAAPDFVAHERFGRAVLFVGPILLLVVQWTLIDRVMDLFAKPVD